MEHVSQTFDKVELPAEHERNTTMTDSNIQPAKDEWERMLSGELYVADSTQQDRKSVV